MKAYKGFDKDMKCRGFQYEEGKEYQCDEAKLCGSGFHACEMPLDVFRYYKPSNSIYYEVECDGVISKVGKYLSDSKFSCTKMKIGNRLSIAEIIKAQVNSVIEKIKSNRDKSGSYNGEGTMIASGTGSNAVAMEGNSNAIASGTRSNAVILDSESYAKAAGVQSTATASGSWSIATTFGDLSIAATSDFMSDAIASGTGSNAVTTGLTSNAVASGFGSNAVTTGFGSNAVTIGDGSNATVCCFRSNAVALGFCSSAAALSCNSIALANGYYSRAKGEIGSYIVLTEWNKSETELLCVKAVKITGKTYKPNVWYTLKGGKVVKHENQDD